MTRTSEHDCALENIFADDEIRCSKDRHTLLDTFDRDRAWTIPQLCKHLAHTATATIYRNVELFVKKEYIHSFALNGKTYYEITGNEHHDHRICDECEKAICVDCPIPKIKNHLLQLSFTCSDCKK